MGIASYGFIGIKRSYSLRYRWLCSGNRSATSLVRIDVILVISHIFILRAFCLRCGISQLWIGTFAIILYVAYQYPNMRMPYFQIGSVMNYFIWFVLGYFLCYIKQRHGMCRSVHFFKPLGYNWGYIFI